MNDSVRSQRKKYVREPVQCIYDSLVPIMSVNYLRERSSCFSRYQSILRNTSLGFPKVDTLPFFTDLYLVRD